MANGIDPSIWQILLQYLWLPVLTLVGGLITLVRNADVLRIKVLEKSVALMATKEDVLRVEMLATKAVQEERFKDYIDHVDEARKETRESIDKVFNRIEIAQDKAANKLERLTERVFSFQDQRQTKRGEPSQEG